MKKCSVKLAGLVLFFATGVAIGMRQEGPKKIYLKNELSPMQLTGYGQSDYTLVCVINDIDDRNQSDYTKYVTYGKTVLLGLSNDIKTLKIRLSGYGTEKGAYVYDYLTDELKKQIAAKAFDPNYTDLTIIVKHYYSWGIWIPKQYDYTWEWNKPKEAQAKPILSISMTLDDIAQGKLGLNYAEKLMEMSTRSDGRWVFNKLKEDFNPAGLSEKEARILIDQAYDQWSMQQSTMSFGEPKKKETPMTLEDIAKGKLGPDYAKKATEVCKANYTKAAAAGYTNLCEYLQKRLQGDVLQGAPTGITTREEAIKRIIDGIYAQLQMYKKPQGPNKTVFVQ